MLPEKGKVYDIEYWDDDVMFNFQAKCVCDQPEDNGCFVFESGGEEIEVDPKDIIREVCTECIR